MRAHPNSDDVDVGSHGRNLKAKLDLRACSQQAHSPDVIWGGDIFVESSHAASAGVCIIWLRVRKARETVKPTTFAVFGQADAVVELDKTMMLWFDGEVKGLPVVERRRGARCDCVHLHASTISQQTMMMWSKVLHLDTAREIGLVGLNLVAEGQGSHLAAAKVAVGRSAKQRDDEHDERLWERLKAEAGGGAEVVLGEACFEDGNQVVEGDAARKEKLKLGTKFSSGNNKCTCSHLCKRFATTGALGCLVRCRYPAHHWLGDEATGKG